MDPLQEIKYLEVKRDKLEQALEQPERVPGEWVAINNRIAAIGNEITAIRNALTEQAKISAAKEADAARIVAEEAAAKQRAADDSICSMTLFSVAGCVAKNPHQYMGFVVLCVAAAVICWYHLSSLGAHGNAVWDGIKLVVIIITSKAQAHMTTTRFYSCVVVVVVVSAMIAAKF